MENAPAKKKSINKPGLLKILFSKLLEDKKIDEAEKTLFLKFKEKFDISEKIYSDILAAAIDERKKKGDLKSAVEDIVSDERAYKISIYSRAYYEMLCGGKITFEENELLTKLCDTLELQEDAVDEAVIQAHELVINETQTCCGYEDAINRLSAFVPGRNHYNAYYYAAYKLLRRQAELSANSGVYIFEAAVEFEKFFIKSAGEKCADCFEKLYYWALLTSNADAPLRKTRFEKALAAAANDKDKARAYFQMAFSFHLNANFDRAGELYKLALEKDPDDSVSGANLVACYNSLKKYELARSFVDENIVKYKDNALFLNNGAITYVRLGDAARAEKILKAALDADEKSIDSLVNLINLNVVKKDKEAANVLFERLKNFCADLALLGSLEKSIKRIDASPGSLSKRCKNK